jgi:hypothetical protein
METHVVRENPKGARPCRIILLLHSDSALSRYVCMREDASRHGRVSRLKTTDLNEKERGEINRTNVQISAA